MSLDTAWERCVICDGPVDTNDSERMQMLDDGPAHQTCVEREIANGDLLRADVEAAL